MSKTVETRSLAFVGFNDHCIIALSSKEDGHFRIMLTPNQAALLVGESARWFTDYFARSCGMKSAPPLIENGVETG